MYSPSTRANSQLVTSFNYEILSPKQRTIVQQCTGEIKERLRRTAQDVWEVGQKLYEVRSQLEHGQFEGWLSAEFGWSRRTAYNFINVYEAFGENTNFAQLDIATSALYKLAAPSTPKSVRQEFLAKAEQGEKITHKAITQVLAAEKNATVVEQSESITSKSPKILKLIPKDTVGLELDNPLIFESPISSESVTTTTQIKIKSGCWYLFDQTNLIFCGDTALAEFCDRCSQSPLAIAVTSDDWDHDWLIDKASNVIVLKESYVDKALIKQIISLLSSEGDTVIFPWLPNGEILVIAYKLKRRIIAGDPSAQNCQNAIAKLGLAIEPLQFSES